MTPKVLVLGSGGREHALLEALSLSPQAPQLFVAPGNAGCYNLGTGVDIKADDVQAVLDFVQAEDIDFVVVGPEAPLVAGVSSGGSIGSVQALRQADYGESRRPHRRIRLL
jgi:phosphoribosylamine--glycine ligase